MRNEYEQYLFPKMAPHQRALLIPDGSASAHLKPDANGSRSGWAVPDMVARAHEYFAWAAQDTSGRVIGLNPWHWKTVNYTLGNYWDLGIADIPALCAVWSEIGREIAQASPARQDTEDMDLALAAKD